MIVKQNTERSGLAHKSVWDHIVLDHLLWDSSLPTLVIIALYIYFKLIGTEENLGKAEYFLTYVKKY